MTVNTGRESCLYLRGILPIAAPMSVPARDTTGTKAMMTSLLFTEFTSRSFCEIVRRSMKVLWEFMVFPRTMTKNLIIPGKNVHQEKRRSFYMINCGNKGLMEWAENMQMLQFLKSHSQSKWFNRISTISHNIMQ